MPASKIAKNAKNKMKKFVIEAALTSTFSCAAYFSLAKVVSGFNLIIVFIISVFVCSIASAAIAKKLTS